MLDFIESYYELIMKVPVYSTNNNTITNSLNILRTILRHIPNELYADRSDALKPHFHEPVVTPAITYLLALFANDHIWNKICLVRHDKTIRL